MTGVLSQISLSVGTRGNPRARPERSSYAHASSRSENMNGIGDVAIKARFCPVQMARLPIDFVEPTCAGFENHTTWVTSRARPPTMLKGDNSGTS
jgi:hypothetical protein